ncbi:MAG TPA: PAS domain S-box protein [Chthoniobacteraceae bacterium]|jgi:PAS domain S-box-containing protein
MSTPPANADFPLANLDALLRRAVVFNQIHDAVVITSMEGVITDWNSGAERIFGWLRSDVIGKTPTIYLGLNQTSFLTEIFGALEAEGKWAGEISFIRKDGSTGRCNAVTVPLIGAAGEELGTLTVQSEIAEKVASAPVAPAASNGSAPDASSSALADELYLLRTLINTVPDPIFCKDRAGRFLLHNQAGRMNDASDGVSGARVGRTVFEIADTQEHADRYHSDDMQVIETGEPVLNREEPFRRSDGSRGWLLTSKFPLRDEKNQVIGLVGIGHDITRIKQDADELQEARMRLVDHVENSPLTVIEWDPSFRVLRWAGQAEATFGWSAEEVLGKHFLAWPFVHLDELESVRGICARLLDGSEQRNVSQIRNLTKAGRVVHCVWQNSVLNDREGRTASILSLVQDVTDRVIAEHSSKKIAVERQALEKKLQEAQKLESLGVLAGGIAHDFNNLLTGVLGNASLARMDLPADSPIQSYLEQVEFSATRAADLCKQMLAYSGKGRFVVKHLDLNAVIQDTARLLQVSISKRAVLKFDLAEGLPVVLGDATQLRQVVMNLIINASEAVAEKSGFISLSTGLTRADRAYLAGSYFAPDLPEGDYVYLEVADNGAGMSQEVLSRIFDPFFTTKFTGRGLGLAAVLGIVRGHKGALKVFSEEGWGTTFKILLPCVEGTAEESGERPTISANWRGSGRVLVVDDEETVRVTTARMVEACGLQTSLADDGRSGLEQFQATPDDFTLVILDLTMPHMDGQEAFRAITELRPNARVLLISGFNEQEAIAGFTGKALAGFLQKPFTFPALRDKLQEILK